MIKTASLSAPVWQLMRRNISPWQIAGYAVANMVGLAIILTALMFYADSTTALGGSREADPFFSTSYEVISKKVEGIGLTPAAFTRAEIDEIRALPWARRVGEFTPSRFTVNASVELGGRGMSSYMFMEAIPDEFFDIRPRGWDFDPSDPFIPVVLSKEYLALYNFGFAAPQGLPQLSEEVVATVPLSFSLSGASGRRATLPGAIAGFSSRLNTIAVPQSFMDWANARFAPGEEALPPSRLIVETDPAQGAEMARYLADHGMESSADSGSADSSRLARFSAIAGGVMAAIGAVISALAIAILFLSIWLILSKSRPVMERLILIGYSAVDIGRPLVRLVVAVNLSVAAVALVLMLVARSLWRAPLATLGLGDASILGPLLLAAAFVAAVTAANILTIRRHLSRL